jgi:hypothetical protein
VTLEEKLEALQHNYPTVYIVLEKVVPHLVENPEEATIDEIDNYNFWVNVINNGDAEQYTINR